MRCSSLFLVLLAGASSMLLVHAQPVPKLNSISKPWIQRGTSARVTLSGENLAEARDIFISGVPGVAAKLIPAAESKVAVESSLGGITSVSRPDGKSIEVELAVEANAALTEREMRVAAPGGVSNPVSFRAGHLPEIESAAKTRRDDAQSITLPAVISGVLNNSAESHFFKFPAKKGQPVIFEVYAARDGSRLDSSLVVLDSAGKELARSEDAAGLDSVIAFDAPADGEYLLDLRDFRYQGGGDYKYRLTAGVLPYVAGGFPFGGQRGETVEVRLKGTNLTGHAKLLLHLAKDAPTGRQEIRASTPLGLSNPFPFVVSDLPHRSESEPNSSLAQADQLSVPGAVNGVIGAKRDYDAFRFQAAKDQRVVFEAQAFAFGSRLDALLILTDDRGEVLQRNDDSTAVDSRLDHTFKEAGLYHVVVEDLLGRGGDDFGYRLTAEIPRPDFTVSILPDSPRIRRAGRVPVRCELTRLNGFSQPVKIFCRGLPTGVFAEPLVIPPSGSTAGVLMLSASADAALGSFPLEIAAVSASDELKIEKIAQPLSGDKPVRQAYLTVLEAAPFSVASATLLANIEQSQSGEVEVLVERRGFNGEIKVTAEAFSPARDGMSRSFDFQPLVLNAGQSSGKLSLRAKPDADLGARHLVLKAEAEADGKAVADYSGPIPLATAQIPFVVTPSLKKLLVTALPESSGSAAAEAVLTLKASRRMNFAGEIQISIEGIPDGVKPVLSNIATNSNETTIKLIATEKAETGKDHNLTVVAAGTHNDRIYRFRSTPVSLTVNAPEKEPDAKVAATK